jgi:hypothetical protein
MEMLKESMESIPHASNGDRTEKEERVTTIQCLLNGNIFKQRQ